MIGNSYQMVSEHDLVTSVMAPRLPLFNGDDPYSWVLRIEEYFQAYQTPESKKVVVAQECLEGVAWRWFQAVEEQDPIKNWLEFRITLFNCCSKIDNDPFDELMALRYENSVLDFWVRFIPIAARLSDIPETFLCDMFIGNLPAEVKKKVREYELRTLPEVIAKAFFVEGQLKFCHQTSTQKEELQNDKEQPVNLLESPTKMVEIKESNHGFKSKLLSEREVEKISGHQFILATKLASLETKVELPGLETTPVLEVMPVLYREKSSLNFPPEIRQTRQGKATWSESNPPLLSMEAHKLFDRGRGDPLAINAVQHETMTISDLDLGLSTLPILHRDMRSPMSKKTCISPENYGWRTLKENPEKPLPCDTTIPGRGGAAYMVETCGLEFLKAYLRPNSALEYGPLCALGHCVVWGLGINDSPLNITQGPIIQLGQLYMVWDPGSSTTPPLGNYKNEVLLAHYTEVPATEKKVGVVGGRFSHSDLVFIENRNTPTARWIFDRGRKVTFQKYPSSPSLNNTIWVIRYFKRLMANSFVAFMFSNWIGNVGEDIWNCLIMSSIRQKRQNEFLLSTYGVLCALTTKIYGLTKENKPFEIIYVFPQVVFLELVSDASQVLRFTHNGLGYENRAFGFYLLATHLRFKDLVGWKRLVNGSIVSVHNTIQVPSDIQRDKFLISIYGNFLSYTYFVLLVLGKSTTKKKEKGPEMFHVKHSYRFWGCVSWVFDKGRTINFGTTQILATSGLVFLFSSQLDLEAPFNGVGVAVFQLVLHTKGRTINLLSWFFDRGRLAVEGRLSLGRNTMHLLAWFFDRGRPSIAVEDLMFFTLRTRKVIGARFYETTIIESSRDEEGHGSHTASTAAGNIVKEASFYDIAKGTARGGVPSARIASYKVCDASGCFGASILSAFDDAIADGVDIITISIGQDAPSYFYNDVTAIGAFHAMEKGILTVHSAGNGGPALGTVASVAPWLMTVAASTTDRRIIDKIVLDKGNGTTIIGKAVNSFTLNGTTFPLVDASNVSDFKKCPDLDPGTCDINCMHSGLVKGKIMLCEISDAFAAGALGSISIGELDDTSFVVPFPASNVNEKDYNTILSYLNSSKNPQATILKSEALKDSTAPLVASFSSRGPNLVVPDIMKPDISAPGVDILAAYSYEASPSENADDKRRVKYNIVSGTSMSCPHVAGAAAYVTTFHPDWSPSAIKSSLMTTAWLMNNTKNSNKEYDYGSGHINPTQAIHPGLVYETLEGDYIKFLCSLIGYDEKKVRLISGDNSTTCPKIRERESGKDLNYPSMTATVAINKPIQVSFHRRIKNVGIANSTYKAQIFSRSLTNIKVVPEVLSFKSLNEELSFDVIVNGGSLTKKIPMVSASLVWSDGTHSVRSPIVLHNSNSIESFEAKLD